MSERHVVVVGAGVGGLASAAALASAGVKVTVLERAPACGGKMRQFEVDGAGIDAGPTVFTMRWVFDELFEQAGERLEDAVQLLTTDVLARHAWTGSGSLDLYTDIQASRDAVEAFASAEDAQGYLDFCARSADIYATLRDSFINAARPGPVTLMQRIGFHRPAALWRTAPYQSLWSALGSHFRDPRLRQLFGRYATYVGSSPLRAPATLMLIAHVEQTGVWLLTGGMTALAAALQSLAERQGATFRFDSGVREIVVSKGSVSAVTLDDGERIACDRVVYNGDVSALGNGLLGDGVRSAAPAVPADRRSLSAVTWCIRGRPRGFPLHYHNVFFDEDYPSEFSTVFRDGDIVARPTVYVCAQDRVSGAGPEGPERLLLLINAPAAGDSQAWLPERLAGLRERALDVLRACGVTIEFDESHCRVTSPADFNHRFPGSGGAIYGRANHGMFASFSRPGSRSKVGGLYLAGGSAHPGAGVPMAALSGRLAARTVLADLEQRR